MDNDIKLNPLFDGYDSEVLRELLNSQSIKILQNILTKSIKSRTEEGYELKVYEMKDMLRFNQHQGFTMGLIWVTDLLNKINDELEDRAALLNPDENIAKEL